jgi:hypothetical protein
MCIVVPHLNCFPAGQSGNEAGSRAEYAMFPNLWKEADADIPVLREARAEYR